MPKISIGTIVKLLVTCFVVGAALTWLDLDPRTLLDESLYMAKRLARWSVDNFGQVVSYIMLGAVVVLPLWAVSYLMRVIRSGTLLPKRFTGSADRADRGPGDDGPATP